MDGLIAQSPSGAWSSGAAIFTTVFPMLLFIAVAGALYILYTKPEVAPGHRSVARPITYTSVPGEPTTADASATPAADRSATPAAEHSATPAAEHSATPAAEHSATSAPDDGAGAAESENVAPKGDE